MARVELNLLERTLSLVTEIVRRDGIIREDERVTKVEIGEPGEGKDFIITVVPIAASQVLGILDSRP